MSRESLLLNLNLRKNSSSTCNFNGHAQGLPVDAHESAPV